MDIVLLRGPLKKTLQQMRWSVVQGNILVAVFIVHVPFSTDCHLYSFDEGIFVQNKNPVTKRHHPSKL